MEEGREAKRQRFDPDREVEVEERVDGETFLERMARLDAPADDAARRVLLEEFEKELKIRRERGSTAEGADAGTDEEAEFDGMHDKEEARQVRSNIPPEAPSESEWRKHRVTHFPYRPWCPDCVAGRGIAGAHCKRKEEDEAPLGAELHFDYCFLKS